MLWRKGLTQYVQNQWCLAKRDPWVMPRHEQTNKMADMQCHDVGCWIISRKFLFSSIMDIIRVHMGFGKVANFSYYQFDSIVGVVLGRGVLQAGGMMSACGFLQWAQYDVHQCICMPIVWWVLFSHELIHCWHTKCTLRCLLDAAQALNDSAIQSSFWVQGVWPEVF